MLCYDVLSYAGTYNPSADWIYGIYYKKYRSTVTLYSALMNAAI